MGSVVEIAAWIIIGEALIRLFLNGHRQRQHEIEAEAVKAEYQACEHKENDEAATEGSRIWSRRREELRMRYPQHLITPPDSKYFAEASRATSQRKRNFREMLPGYVVAALVAIAMWVFGAAIGVAVSLVCFIVGYGFWEARKEWRTLGK